MKTVITRSGKQTQDLGEKIAKKLRGSEIFALYGELGSGKTQFVKGLAAGLGIKQHVVSPTFSLINHYIFKKSGKKLNFYHLDLYRLRKKREAVELGLPEILSRSRRIIAIEWPQIAESLLPAGSMTIFFSHGRKANERRIKISDALL
ncbi:MAG: tRNA (adenosine(37)-N6)-threonylcarbamoyltransferase complex ATPase subunit type 1 TsaE [Patescibacteria group bacterium]